MKALSSGKHNWQKGSSTLEILIAFAILVLSISAVIGVIFGNQSISVDTQVNNEAIYRAQKLLEDARANSRNNFLSVVSTSSNENNGVTYQKTLAVTDLSQCQKQATSTVQWTTGTRTLKVELTTFLGDVAGALALGGDCIINSSGGPKWDNPQRFASDTVSPGKPTALDELNRMVYLGVDKSPFFMIADTSSATLGQTGGLFLTYANSFDEEDIIYDMDAIQWKDGSGNTKYYAFLATASTTAQLKVVDVTDPLNPTVVAKRSLAGVGGSFPEGWRVAYFGNRIYILTRETAGPELHIFNATTPSNPTELGSGISLNATAEDIALQERTVSGSTKRYLYLPTDQNSAELRVFDVTDSGGVGAATEVTAVNVNLSGNTDAASVYVIGNKLYLGRLATGGPDLYVYDLTNMPTSISELGSVDLDTGALSIVVAGKFGFISTPKVNQEFQVWNITNPSSITNIAKYNFGNIVDQGIDYDPEFIYATGQSTPNLQIIYSP